VLARCKMHGLPPERSWLPCYAASAALPTG
jgi:hypothetical protein